MDKLYWPLGYSYPAILINKLYGSTTAQATTCPFRKGHSHSGCIDYELLIIHLKKTTILVDITNVVINSLYQINIENIFTACTIRR